MNKLRIFTGPSAFPNPQRVRLLVHEKGIADRIEEVVYDMAPGGQQRSWQHLKMNSWGETPTLALADGTYLSESAAIARYLDLSFPGRKITGDTAQDQALDTMWDDRVYNHVLYRIVTMFHVLHQGLGFKLEPVHNEPWGEYCRAQAMVHAGKIDAHLADGREWLIGGSAPTFADMTMCVAIAFSKYPTNKTPLDERFEHIDAYWKRWQRRASFKAAYSDGASGLNELAPLNKAA